MAVRAYLASLIALARQSLPRTARELQVALNYSRACESETVNCHVAQSLLYCRGQPAVVALAVDKYERLRRLEMLTPLTCANLKRAPYSN